MMPEVAGVQFHPQKGAPILATERLRCPVNLSHLLSCFYEGFHSPFVAGLCMSALRSCMMAA